MIHLDCGTLTCRITLIYDKLCRLTNHWYNVHFWHAVPGQADHSLILLFIGLPDLTPNATRLEQSAYLQDRYLYYLQCAFEENCLSSSAEALYGTNCKLSTLTKNATIFRHLNPKNNKNNTHNNNTTCSSTFRTHILEIE